MAFTLDDVIGGVHASRRFFLKHLAGLREEQWSWKPYPECKSIRETLIHLVGDDRAALQSLQTGKEPDYEGILEAAFAEMAGADTAQVQAQLEESHEKLCAHVLALFADAPLDAEACIWGSAMKVGRGVAYLSSEDFYHAGQVAFIRMATDPAWDYYGSVYGG